VPVPRGLRAATPEQAAAAAETLRGPVALKALGLAHKTEAGAVALHLTTPGAVRTAAARMPPGPLLLEEMVTGTVAELLVGVLRDPAHGFVLTLGAGGTLAEVLADSASLLLPARRSDVARALDGLRIAPLLRGYRGAPPACRTALLDAIMALQDCAIAHAATLLELEINPLIVTPDRAVAADALIRLGETP
jgi:succinyl-CoA synthetase beta subunit